MIRLATWFLFDLILSITGLWVLIFTQCFLQVHDFTTISECMRIDYKYQVLVIVLGAYLGTEYVAVLLQKKDKLGQFQKDVMVRIYVVGWCGLFGAMVIAVRDSEANGYPHDTFTALLAVGLLTLAILALKVKVQNLRKIKTLKFWAWIAEALLLGMMLSAGFLTGFDVDRPLFEYVAGTCMILGKGFRYFEFTP